MGKMSFDVVEEKVVASLRSNMIPSQSRIKRSEYKKALADTRAFYTSLFTLSYKKSLENKHKFSIVVGKTVCKSAVGRNKLKRVMASLLQKHTKKLENKGVFIVFMKKGSEKAPVILLEKEVQNAIKPL